LSLHYCGIRHHGPGSAKRVLLLIEQYKPDCVLVEGPPDAQDMLLWTLDPGFKLPVALLIYMPEEPAHSVFYPFARYSPEWQAIQYSTAHNIPLRWMDLPCYHSFALKKEKKETLTSAEMAVEKFDPIAALGKAAGYSTQEELWWELYAEDTITHVNLTLEINNAFTEIRGNDLIPGPYIEKLREAWMRRSIRQAQKDGYENILIICGAWHIGTLQLTGFKAKDDDKLLKKLPKTKTSATWIPWTNDRLAYDSGYGAGVYSPGYYEHIWDYLADEGLRWLSKVAAMLRKKNMDISSAQVIEAIRLAQNLAALRGYPRVSLQELNDACISVFGHGDDILLRLIRSELITGHQIGEVPALAPRVPLLADIEKEQKKWRLKPESGEKILLLDLREENDLGKSIFLHRLCLLQIRWGDKHHVRSKGTFKEQWNLRWKPELLIQIIEKAPFGNTLALASENYICKKLLSTDLLELGDLLKAVIPSELPQLTQHLIRAIEQASATTQDVLGLMNVVPQLVQIIRYGNVRRSDAGQITVLVESMLRRIYIGLPPACLQVDEAGIAIADKIFRIEHAVCLLQNIEHNKSWEEFLLSIHRHKGTQAYIDGSVSRLLIDHEVLSGLAAENTLRLALSMKRLPREVAAWLEGFLRGSGMILLADATLFLLLYEWVQNLGTEDFQAILPLLRRSFSHFEAAERRKIGEKVKNFSLGIGRQASKSAIDISQNRELGWAGIDIIMQIFKVSGGSENDKT